MKNDKGPIRSVAILCLMIASVLILGMLLPSKALAQDPPRTYWKYLSGGDALVLLYESISGNANPFDPTHRVSASSTFDATLEIAAYAHTFALLDRAAVATVMLPMGRLASTVTVPLTGGGVTSVRETANGFSDPTLELNVNLIGPPAQKNIPDMMRYEPGFSVDIVCDLAVPVGEYDNSKPLNIGQNRWYGRVGFPVVWQLGPWIPGKRTTLEFVPAVWLFGANNDFYNSLTGTSGNTLRTEPMYQLDSHLTRDLYERAWVSLDASAATGGMSSINGVDMTKSRTQTLGLTLGYQVNDNMNLSFTYKSTINDSEPTAMRMDMFMVTLIAGWHPVLEGSKRLKSE
jgi:hypothetical protein